MTLLKNHSTNFERLATQPNERIEKYFVDFKKNMIKTAE